MKQAGAGVTEILVFLVSGQRYALPLPSVQEVQRAVAVTPLPKAPAVIEGVINLRGAVVPVLDLRARFKLPASPVSPSDQLIIASAGGRVVAVRVDQVLDLARLEAGALETLVRTVPKAEYVAGVAKLPDGLVLIHDLETFLTRAEAETLAVALA